MKSSADMGWRKASRMRVPDAAALTMRVPITASNATKPRRSPVIAKKNGISAVPPIKAAAMREPRLDPNAK
jgi:hypothetical protein